ncbi:MAG: hypothetical protein ISR65_16935 [Bacteriovoracaceae bacterium]|nr:hypothetical protein [Bacteriovoracaceae bacterium]
MATTSKRIVTIYIDPNNLLLLESPYKNLPSIKSKNLLRGTGEKLTLDSSKLPEEVVRLRKKEIEKSSTGKRAQIVRSVFLNQIPVL